MGDVSFNFRRPRVPTRGVGDAARTAVANRERTRNTAVSGVGSAVARTGRTTGSAGRTTAANRSRAAVGAAAAVGRAAAAAGGGPRESSPRPTSRSGSSFLDRARRAAGKKSTTPRQPDKPRTPAPRSAPVPRPATSGSAAPATRPAPPRAGKKGPSPTPTRKATTPASKGAPSAKSAAPKKGTLLHKATHTKTTGEKTYSKADFNRALSRYRRTHKGVSTAHARTIASYLAGKGFGSKDKKLSGPRRNANQTRNRVARAVNPYGGPDSPR